MKYWLCISLVFVISSGVTAQRKSSKDNPVNELLPTHKLIRSIYELREIYHNIYFRASRWIFDGDTEELQSDINSRYPPVKLSIDKQLKQLKNKSLNQTTDSLLIDVFRQIEYANEIMAKLDHRDKYFDANDNRTDNWKNLKQVYLAEMLPLHQKIEKNFDQLISAYKKQLEMALATSATSKQKTIRVDEVKKRLKQNYRILDIQHDIRKIYMGTYAWVYISEAAILKTELQTLLQDVSHQSDSISFKSNGFAQGNLLRADDPKLLIREFLKHCGRITDSLATPESYEDPEILFMAEIEIESDVWLQLQSILSSLKPVQQIIESDLEILLANPDDSLAIQKRKDIVKLLKINRISWSMIIEPMKTKLLKEGNTASFNALEALKYEDVIEGLIPIYDRLFTAEEITEILKFQTSKAGKKLQQQSLTLSMETLQYIVSYINKVLEANK